MNRVVAYVVGFFLLAAGLLIASVLFADKLDSYFTKVRKLELARQHKTIIVRAAAPLPAGTLLKRAVLSEEVVATEAAPNDAVSSMRDAAERSTVRAIEHGSIIKDADLTARTQRNW